jgi:hypothetical protein
MSPRAAQQTFDVSSSLTFEREEGGGGVKRREKRTRKSGGGDRPTRTKEGFHALELELAFFGLRRQWDLEVCAKGPDERVPRHRVLFAARIAESWRTTYVSARRWGCVGGGEESRWCGRRRGAPL